MGLFVAVHRMDGIHTLSQVMDVNHIGIIRTLDDIAGKALDDHEVGIQGGITLGQVQLSAIVPQ